ncbi:MAG: type II toxin-antitoxin system RelE/ParE family toxin [Opitutaceae bacterium]
MIQSFNGKHAEKLWGGQRTKLPADILRRALDKLTSINYSQSLEDLRAPPSNHLEALSGNRIGQHSIRINNQWRICFRWEDGHAHEVEITDYH